jgi:hypothetical protein
MDIGEEWGEVDYIGVVSILLRALLKAWLLTLAFHKSMAE